MEHHQFEQVEEIRRPDFLPFVTSVDQNFIGSLFSEQLFGTETFLRIETTQLMEHSDFSCSADDFHGPVVSSNSTLLPRSDNLPFATSEGEAFITSVFPPIAPQAAQILALETSQRLLEPGSGVPFTYDFLTSVQSSCESVSTALPSINETGSTEYPLSTYIHELSGGSDNRRRARDTKKRTRRVVGPVKGNNKSGQRGKLICWECRKIRSKATSICCSADIQCIYTSIEQPCEFCVLRSRICVKVPGPKKRRVQKESHLDRNKKAAPLAFPLMADCNLPGHQVSILQNLYHQYHDPSRMCSNHVFFQHLWGEYGLTPADKCLLFANLLYGSRVFRHCDERVLKSQFHSIFLAAFEKNQITDCHLFAVVLAAESCVAEDLVSIGVYKGWFFEILKRLSNQDGLPKDGSRRRLLQFASSLMRRVIPLHSRNDAKITLHYLNDINVIPEDIWSQTNITVQDPRLARVLPIRVCQGDQLSWMEVMECFLDDRYNMFLSFQRFAYSNQGDEERQNWRRSLISVRQNVNNILQFPDVSGFLNYIQETQESVIQTGNSTNRGSWHVSRARGFLRTFFHNLALLTVVEYLASDDTEEHSTWNVIQQVFQAEYTLSLHEESLFASVYHGREALFGTIGILLAPQFVVEKEDLNQLQNQVIEGWKRYWDGLGIFWCPECPCRPTSRVKRFWKTSMLKDDYIRFLSQNPWIWGIPMKGFEDVRLDLDEIEKAQGPCMACGKIWWDH